MTLHANDFPSTLVYLDVALRSPKHETEARVLTVCEPQDAATVRATIPDLARQSARWLRRAPSRSAAPLKIAVWTASEQIHRIAVRPDRAAALYRTDPLPDGDRFYVVLGRADRVPEPEDPEPEDPEPDGIECRPVALPSCPFRVTIFSTYRSADIAMLESHGFSAALIAEASSDALAH